METGCVGAAGLFADPSCLQGLRAEQGKCSLVDQMTQEHLVVWSPETEVPGTLLGESPLGLRTLGVETPCPLEGTGCSSMLGSTARTPGAQLSPSVVPQAGRPMGWGTASAPWHIPCSGPFLQHADSISVLAPWKRLLLFSGFMKKAIVIPTP